MQTKKQIQRLLESAGVRPNKQLGQHFLTDLNLMRLLVDRARINNDDVVLEVGCGTGSLTEGIAEKAGFCVAVELDGTLARIAEERLARAGNVAVINTDILESKNAIDPAVTNALNTHLKEYSGRLLLVANLPYNAASAVIVNLITGPIRADAMYATVQKEVADRMTASPGGAEYGTLSIFIGAAGDIRMERILKPSVFWPRPQVSSAMVSFERIENKAGRIHNMATFRELVNLLMSHRRKMLQSCIRFAREQLAKITDWQSIFEHALIEPRTRPEQLSPEQYVMLANLCDTQLKSETGDRT